LPGCRRFCWLRPRSAAAPSNRIRASTALRPSPPGGDEVQVVRALGAVYDGGAEVVLRLRLEGIDSYGHPTVDGPRCFAYRFDGGTRDGTPVTLERCPAA